ncbi:TNT domain-containing protein [Streptomyces sp. NBC_01429]|uniref:TNT domain-containing protein n=1 Tax=Streptomyces sp. NBC_01429 TaxID=2903862 RepID=UPI002E2B565E|nr:TNT domain-containing protein [Streptomyces sp. NBC_01429]
MNRMRTLLAGLGITALLAMAPAAHAAPPERPTESGRAVASAPPTAAIPLPPRPEPCTGKFRDDARLGPEHLPNRWQAPVGPLLKGYHRTGHLSPAAFLKKYWEGPADSGSWKYPPNDGFADVNGVPDKNATELRAGERLDRFGSEFGSYLAPAGDAYAKRALPPQNLNTRDEAFPCDYHVYKVVKPFSVWQGGIAPWFEQPGRGQQIKLDPVFLDPGPGERLSVKWLLDHDYLAPAGA